MSRPYNQTQYPPYSASSPQSQYPSHSQAPPRPVAAAAQTPSSPYGESPHTSRPSSTQAYQQTSYAAQSGPQQSYGRPLPSSSPQQPYGTSQPPYSQQSYSSHYPQQPPYSRNSPNTPVCLLLLSCHYLPLNSTQIPGLTLPEIHRDNHMAHIIFKDQRALVLQAIHRLLPPMEPLLLHRWQMNSKLLHTEKY